MHALRVAARYLLLTLVGIAMIFIWLYCDMLIPGHLVNGGMGSTAAQVCAAVITTFVLGVAPALPIQVLFPCRPVRAACAIGWMPLALALSLHDFVAPFAVTEKLLGTVVEGTAAWFATAGCVWLVARVRRDGGAGVKSA